MNGFVGNIEQMTQQNADFRHVVYTGEQLQLVLMTLPPGEEIGVESHHDRDQFFRVEEGIGKAIIDGVDHQIRSGEAIIVPARILHNVVNTGDAPLKLYTLYAPPEHKDGFIAKTKADAMHAHEHFDHVTTEKPVPVYKQSSVIETEVLIVEDSEDAR
jgi:mannose-6-phosphate isomerase-like protein (cupin superfamily)